MLVVLGLRGNADQRAASLGEIQVTGSLWPVDAGAGADPWPSPRDPALCSEDASDGRGTTRRDPAMRRSTIATSGLALSAALLLAGCAGGESADPAAESSSASSAASDASSTTPGAAGAGAAEEVSTEHGMGDVMFAQMMIPHHEQALEMSEILLSKDGVPEDVRAMAEQIQAAQGPEIERMMTMLTAWDAPYDEQMDHSGHGGMDGMLSEDELQELRDADGTQAASLYLEGMISHHEGAVEMARQHQEDGENAQALALSEQVIASQEKEIAQMQDMLDAL